MLKVINRLPVQHSRRSTKLTEKDGWSLKRKTEEESEVRRASNCNQHKPNKTRKYDEAYIGLGFIINTVGNEAFWQRTE